MRMSYKEKFKYFIENKLAPEFGIPRGGWSYISKSEKLDAISEYDAFYFMRGYEARVVTHMGRGQYLAAFGAAKQQFFSSGSTKANPRTFSIWIEPIITVAALGRLHLEFGWPKELLGLETSAYAFDASTFLSTKSKNEYIACEAKSNKREFECLISTIKKLSCGDLKK